MRRAVATTMSNATREILVGQFRDCVAVRFAKHVLVNLLRVACLDALFFPIVDFPLSI
jgi:hypothetical protein